MYWWAYLGASSRFHKGHTVSDSSTSWIVRLITKCVVRSRTKAMEFSLVFSKS
jgi:hypothetical protein